MAAFWTLGESPKVQGWPTSRSNHFERERIELMSRRKFNLRQNESKDEKWISLYNSRTKSQKTRANSRWSSFFVSNQESGYRQTFRLACRTTEVAGSERFKKCVKVEVSAEFHNCHFYSATIAATAFRALWKWRRKKIRVLWERRKRKTCTSVGTEQGTSSTGNQHATFWSNLSH